VTGARAGGAAEKLVQAARLPAASLFGVTLYYRAGPMPSILFAPEVLTVSSPARRPSRVPLLLVVSLLLAGCAALGPSAREARAPHPLDDLTPEEIQAAVKAVRASGRFTEAARFPIVMTREPDKARRLAGETRPRQAWLAVHEPRKGELWEVTVDLPAGGVVDAVLVPGAQPPILLDEYDEVEKIVKADERWKAAMARRGITNPDDVAVDGWAAGLLSPAEQQAGDRLMRGLSYYKGAGIQNFYARPIEGVVVTVDMNTGHVVDVLDAEVTPVATGKQDLAEKDNAPVRRDLKRLATRMPEGVSFQVEGQQIRWQKWRFRYSLQPMKGLVLYDVGYEDGGRVRPIVYKLSLAEMLVPYSDPRRTWSFRNAFDVGEYGIGRTAHRLDPLVDVPPHAVFFDGNFATDAGEAMAIERAVAVYERDGGLMWKHHDEANEVMHARRARQLVVTFMTTVGNYDYGINYVFHQDGVLEVEVELTGILLAQGSAMSEDACTPACHSLVERHLLAPPHQHFFSFRIDLDVDGPANTPVETSVVAGEPGGGNPDGNAFLQVERALHSEKEAVGDLDLATHRAWKVVNPAVRNALGQPVGYAVAPGPNSLPYLAPESQIRQRARFIDHHMWFTRYRDAEQGSAGSWPNQGQPGQGLPEWVANDEPLEGEDVVAWYTFGITHVPRPEEWPVMNATRAGFRLMPVGFFARNPAMDLPEVPKAAIERELSRRRK
jgi:primary-amine oxidase